MNRCRILFSGYAKVHFVCFLPVYQVLRQDPELELYLSGGFKKTEGDQTTFEIDGFYDDFPVDHEKILDSATAKTQDFDVVVCAQLSDALFPRSARSTVQIFHGVSFKNLAGSGFIGLTGKLETLEEAPVFAVPVPSVAFWGAVLLTLALLGVGFRAAALATR